MDFVRVSKVNNQQPAKKAGCAVIWTLSIPPSQSHSEFKYHRFISPIAAFYRNKSFHYVVFFLNCFPPPPDIIFTGLIHLFIYFHCTVVFNGVNTPKCIYLLYYFNYFIYLERQNSEKVGERKEQERDCFMLTLTVAGRAQNQEPGSPFRFLMWVDKT